MCWERGVGQDRLAQFYLESLIFYLHIQDSSSVLVAQNLVPHRSI